jgi:redox-sensitive bicupin YhaK (pirin superfamily)
MQNHPSNSQKSPNPVINIHPLGTSPTPWPTMDPFLFCVYHDDKYPAGNGNMAPNASLAGRQIGQDFSGKDGWSMYHGQTVPGFPSHPHRGFETVTIVRKGLIDHSDSLGATARFGGGDTQWLTAGGGIVHSEMFPLMDATKSNPLELFQIWLNLPAKSKMVPAHFTMLWNEKIARHMATDVNGKTTEIAVIAGSLMDNVGAKALPPPPDSWASQPESDLAILTLKLAPGARWTLPKAAKQDTKRQLYCFKGSKVTVAEQATGYVMAELRGDVDVEIFNGGNELAEFLLLQARPIGEPVAQYGPFVMNTQAEIRQAITDYQRTQFGGWPYKDGAPVHGRDPARFAKHVGGKEERPVT